jgi:hypothetical protein
MQKRAFPEQYSKRKLFSEIITGLLLIFFINCVISSYHHIPSLQNMLTFYTYHYKLLAWVIVIAEVMISLLLFFHQTRLIGFVTVIAISLFAGVLVIKTPGIPHDFGGILNDGATSRHVLIYSTLIILSSVGFFISKRSRKLKSKTESPKVIFT